MAELRIDISEIVDKAIDSLIEKGWKPESWISVNDALPELEKNVLIYAVGKEKCYESKITITRRTDVIWFGHEVKTEPYWKDPWQYFGSDYEITHWMPLPEPPEKE